MLRFLADWLAQLAPLAPYVADGICTGTAEAAPGCALCDAGESSCVTSVTGRCTETRRYTLFVRAVCLLEAERAALAQACGQAAQDIAAASAAGALPDLPDGCAADALRCTGMRLCDIDDSGLVTYELTLLFTYTGPDVPAL